MKLTLENLTKLRLILDTEGIGPSKLFNLISKFNSIDNLLNASFYTLASVQGISSNLANRLIAQSQKFQDYKHKIEKELDVLEKLDAKWTTFWSSDYPINLKNIFAPPVILYYTGNLLKNDNNAIAVVGTRMATHYGKALAKKFSSELAKNGITIISGMARGIDSAAHRGAIEAGGRTIAVVGSGLDVIYPPENKKLFEEISKNGAVISEYSLRTKPDAQNFPKRNRIISGLSLGTLVVETNISGGALQTAAFALDQNREVFAIPGNLGVPQSEGTNLIIQKGEAKLVKKCDDILVELNLKIQPQIGQNIPKPPIDLNLFEKKVYDSLSKEPKHIDLIANETEINSSECLVHLLSLEFRDLVKQLPGKTFVKI